MLLNTGGDTKTNESEALAKRIAILSDHADRLRKEAFDYAAEIQKRGEVVALGKDN